MNDLLFLSEFARILGNYISQHQNYFIPGEIRRMYNFAIKHYTIAEKYRQEGKMCWKYYFPADSLVNLFNLFEDDIDKDLSSELAKLIRRREEADLNNDDHQEEDEKMYDDDE